MAFKASATAKKTGFALILINEYGKRLALVFASLTQNGFSIMDPFQKR